MSEKQKPARERLILRSGGFVIFAPIVAGFMALLLILTFMVGVVLFLGTPETGLPADVVSASVAVWVLIVATLITLSYMTLRYVKGIGNLAQQRRGVKQEEKRIEQLQISQTGISNGMTDDDLAAYAEVEMTQNTFLENSS